MDAGSAANISKASENETESTPEEELAKIIHLTERFRNNLQSAIGSEVYTQFMEVCRSLEGAK